MAPMAPRPSISSDSVSKWGSYFKYRKSCMCAFSSLDGGAAVGCQCCSGAAAGCAWVLVPLQGAAAVCAWALQPLQGAATLPQQWPLHCAAGAATKVFLLSGVSAGVVLFFGRMLNSLGIILPYSHRDPPNKCQAENSCRGCEDIICSFGRSHKNIRFWS